MLEIKNLTKIYDNGFKALDNVSFTIPDGQFVALIGLSGSGKSTLLRCINRLIEPTEGQIIWNGLDLTAISVRAPTLSIGGLTTKLWSRDAREPPKKVEID